MNIKLIMCAKKTLFAASQSVCLGNRYSNEASYHQNDNRLDEMEP